MVASFPVRGVRLVGACLLAAVLAGAASLAPRTARADEGATRTVPELLRLKESEARVRLAKAGLRVGTVFRVSPARILAHHKVRFPAGYVFRHRPEAGVSWAASKPVDLIVCASRDGLVPPYMRDTQPTARRPAPGPSKAGGTQPGRTQPGSAAPTKADTPRPAAASVAEGSPDAPRAARKPDRNRVPSLVGLDLVDAEHLVRESEMSLHVERVPGHPLGKVLEQVPAAGAKRPPAGMLKVVITAGGDYEARMPRAPAVYLAEIAVPGLLDRTQPQAERILNALGLRFETEIAKRGLAGRVVDQMPAGGGNVPKGGIVRLWIGPHAVKTDEGAPPPPFGPLGAKGYARKTDAPEGAATKKATPPPPDGPLKAGIPQPVSPSVNTPIPVGAKVPVGFTWRGVTGANAYLIEIEEQGAEGRWLPLARKPARSTAVLFDVERFDDKGAARLRWRVTAIVGGRQGKASAWVLLR